MTTALESGMKLVRMVGNQKYVGIKSKGFERGKVLESRQYNVKGKENRGGQVE
jgi:hypothetical protein